MRINKKVKSIAIASGISLLFVVGAIVLLLAAEVIRNPFDKDFGKTYSVVFVIGAHSNSKTINFASDSVMERIERLAKNYGTLSVVVADGRPTQQAFVSILEEPDALQKLMNFFGNENSQKQRQEKLLDYLKSQKAVSPGVDMLEALNTAARQLNDRLATDIKEIIVLGTGLSTTGFLDFVNNESYLYTDPDYIVTALKEEKNLPDFSGINVIWYQMHDVNEPQEVFDGVQRENLELIWRGIVENGGGTFEIKSAIPGNDFYGSERYPDYPPVPVVNVRPKGSVIMSVTIAPKTTTVNKGDSFTFSATVEGTNDPTQDVMWTIPFGEPHTPNTYISNDGVLHISPDETESTITVRANAVSDPAKYGEAYITVGNSEISGIRISPANIIAKRGMNFQLEAIVLGSFSNTPQNVSWSVDGGNKNTLISQNGLLSVASNETATTLDVVVTSQSNINVSESLKVVVVPDDVKVMFYGNQPETDVPNNGKPYFIGGRPKAVDVIKEWASYIKNQDKGVYLFGCTAKADSPENESYESHKQLGQRRADAVKEILITEFGVDPNKIITLGLGYDSPWYIDNGLNGISWNEAIASENRRVYVMPIGDNFADSVYRGEWR